MRAVRVDRPGAAAVVDVPCPVPAPGEVVVRVRAAAICATDRRLVAGGADPARIPGHEVAGVTDAGEAVGVHPDVGCATCDQCRAGLPNRCPRRRSVGLDRDGGLAQCLTVPRAHALPLRGVPLPVAPLLEPLACCLHAVALLPEPPRRAAVVGAGAMGILCTWALQALGSRVLVCQRSPARRTLAAELGADATCGPDEDPARALAGAPDAVIVTARGAEPLTWGLRHVAVGGVVHAFAGSPGGAPIDANLVHYRHLRLIGSTGSTLADYRRALDLVGDGHIDLGCLPRRTIDLDEAPVALTEPPAATVLRTMIRLEDP